jgi:4-amino-4-deoxychorismate lyase
VIGRRLVNGVEGAGIAADDRGLQYGDGLFETMAVVGGRIRHFDLHMTRLAEGCHRLGMPAPPIAHIEADCERVLEGLGSAVIKLILTRGPGPRGYPPPLQPSLTRVITATAAHPPETDPFLTVRVCETRLGCNARLAGMKHLNRLEQVLAGAELRDPIVVDEGLMLSTDDRLVCGTASNVFLVRDGVLHTPRITDCGVAGVMRQVVLRAAEQIGVAAEVRDVPFDELQHAQEVFLTNAVRGIRPIGVIERVAKLPPGPVTARLREALEAGPA